MIRNNSGCMQVTSSSLFVRGLITKTTASRAASQNVGTRDCALAFGFDFGFDGIDYFEATHRVFVRDGSLLAGERSCVVKKYRCITTLHA